METLGSASILRPAISLSINGTGRATICYLKRGTIDRACFIAQLENNGIKLNWEWTVDNY